MPGVFHFVALWIRYIILIFLGQDTSQLAPQTISLFKGYFLEKGTHYTYIVYMNIIEVTNRFDTQEKCVEYLEQLRWEGSSTCPYCNGTRTVKRKNVLRHKCHECNRSFSVLIGTIMEATKLPLPKWFAAMTLMLNAKKGLSSLQLARDIDVNKNTAWYLQKRIRRAMDEDDEILNGIVEIDETYVGGSLTKKQKAQKAKRNYHSSGMAHKKPVLGLLQRHGKIVVKVLNKAWGKEIKP